MDIALGDQIIEAQVCETGRAFIGEDDTSPVSQIQQDAGIWFGEHGNTAFQGDYSRETNGGKRDGTTL